LLSFLLVLICASLAWSQSSGGGIGNFNTVEVYDSVFNYGFARHFYGGSGTGHRMNYTGTGGLFFDYQVKGSSVFLLTGTGGISHRGPFTTYMVGLKDTDRSHALVHKWNENDSADRVLNWSVNGATRSISLSDDLLLGVLTNTRLLSTDGSGRIGSTDLIAWIAGTANDVTVTDDLDGTITLSTVNLGDIVAGDGLTGGADDVLPGPDADVTLNADANLLVFGFPNQIEVYDDGNGRIIIKLPQDIDTGATPSFVTTHLSSLTASRLVSTDSSKVLESTNATAWIAGSANDVTVGDDGDGSVTLSTVTLGDIVAAGTGMSGGADNVLPGADSDVTVTLTVAKDIVAGTGLTGGADDVLPGADADVTINADANLLVSGTANDVTVTDDLDGTITLSTVPYANTVTVGASGCDYTTIQAALTANAASVLVLVAPGTYTDDTITFTASEQTVKGMGLTPNAHVTTADTAIVNFGAYTGCRVENLKLSMTAVTTAKDMITGSGQFRSRWCHFEQTCVTDIVGAAQPSIINTTGDAKFRFGTMDYNHSGESVQGIKAPILLGTGAVVIADEASIDVDTQGDALASTSAYGTSTGVFHPNRCEIDVANIPELASGLEDTFTIGHAYATGSGTHELMANNIHVSNDGSTGVGIYVAGTVTARVMHGHIHVESSTGTANSYYIAAAGATIISQLVDVIAADEENNAGAGTFTYVYSPADGDWNVSGDLTVDGETTFTPSATQVIDAVGDTILANARIVVLDPDADYTLTSTPTIANGTTGDLVYLTVANTETNVITVQDQDLLGGSNLELLGDTVIITPSNPLMLYFDGTDWRELGRGALALEEVVFPPSSTQAITAVGDAILANATLVILNPDGDYTLTSTPTIADSTDGQVLYIAAANAEANSVTIQDESGLGNSNLELMGETATIAGKTVVGLIFYDGAWVEFGTQITNEVTNLRVKGKVTIINELNIPHDDNPSTTEDTELAYDTNDDALEVYAGTDDSESRLIPTIHCSQVLIFAPDGVNDQIPIFHCDAEEYPHGIQLMNVQITLPVDAAYSMVFEEWAGDPPAAQADIETVTTAGTDAYMEVRTTDIDNRDIDADDYIFLDIPATDVDWIHCAAFFYINDGD